MDLSNVNKKLFKYLFIGIGIFIGIFIVIFIIKLIIGSKMNYQNIENKMQQAAINYLKKNDNNVELPNGNESLVIKVDDLVANKNMKELKKYLKNDEISCDGKVIVRKNNDEYLYIPYLDCKEDYKTLELREYIIQNDGIKTQDDGLYLINNEYVFRGEYPNNYVKFANQLWRIIKIDSEGNIKLIQDETKIRNNWDDRYNVDFKSTVGVNNYELSRVHDRLSSLYDEIFTTGEDKKYITSKNLCVGKRYLEDTSKDGTTECNQILENQKIGLIQINEFLIASIDPNCNKVNDGSCQNYNYMSSYKDEFWSITPVATDTSKVYSIRNGSVKSYSASITKLIRPIIYLNSDVIYSSGDGTKENPYIFK